MSTRQCVAFALALVFLVGVLVFGYGAQHLADGEPTFTDQTIAPAVEYQPEVTP